MIVLPQERLSRAPLTLSHLTKSYDGQVVVDDLSLEIQPGEILGLLGPNGAGKSTTINMISGVTPPDSGSIQVFGYDNGKEFIRTRRLVGVMHQDPIIEQYLTIAKTLEIHSGYFGVADDPQWRELLIEHLGLGPYLDKKYVKLSGGMRRRFMIAKTLLHKPRLLILDEPTAGVDVELRSRLWDFVREINKSGISVLLTTHYLEEAEQMCDRIAVLNQGKLVALEETKVLINKIGDQKLKIRFGKPLKAVPEKLNVFPHVELQTDARCLSFTLKTSGEMAQVLQIATQLGLDIEDIDVSHPDLEGAFRQLTDAEASA